MPFRKLLSLGYQRN
ncbi:hypothetical protein CGLO_11809 [Colletotrichum gloeosporioides Cg-14]|uniref:Uncharacterized protein n=1 Tax=Colletotrichum gloeosporioides (strain Cg-14) TaxID=1237896 RepID=T0LAV2_COLGC|nr:hypothetical protein CGLO_11809 [Colletotrichum gloeosporioides Cg-14]